jgi:hypothetical protein
MNMDRNTVSRPHECGSDLGALPLRIAFVADPDGNLVELLSSDEIVEEL